MRLIKVLSVLPSIKTPSCPEGVFIAMDLGVHAHCSIDSNCPKAIELRKSMEKAGVTLPLLLEADKVSDLEGNDFNPEGLKFPPLPALQFPETKSLLTIMNKTVEIDFTPMLQEEFRRALVNKVSSLTNQRAVLIQWGRNFYEKHRQLLSELKSKQAIPALTLTWKDKSKGFFYSIGNGCYNFYIPFHYHPQYMVKSGKRFGLPLHYCEKLQKKISLLVQVKYNTGKILEVILIDESGEKFRHYHGNNNDCWGQVKYPTEWDGDTDSLYKMTTLLENSLATINYDSPMLRTPPDMPGIDILLGESHLLGEEGNLSPQQGTQEIQSQRRWN